MLRMRMRLGDEAEAFEVENWCAIIQLTAQYHLFKIP